MDALNFLDDIEKYCNIFDAVVNSIGPVALENDGTRTRVLTRFETILTRFNFAVPIITQIMQIVKQFIRLIRFGQQLYQLIMSTLNEAGLNGLASRPLRY